MSDLTRIERFALLLAPRLAWRYLNREIRVAELESQRRTIVNQRCELRRLQHALGNALKRLEHAEADLAALRSDGGKDA